MFGLFEKSPVPKKEVHVPVAEPADPKDAKAMFQKGTPLPSVLGERPFEGYTTLDGESVGEQAEIRRFNEARGFVPVENLSSQVLVPRIPAKEAEAPVQDSEGVLVRQQALEMPQGVEGQELVLALEAKQNEFKRYFEEKWKGKMWESSTEKDADLECLATLQGRVAGARRRGESSERSRIILGKIGETQHEQMRTDVVSTQEKLLGKLNETPLAEADTRRGIQEDIRELGALLKPENKEALRVWWDAHSQLGSFPGTSSSKGEDGKSDWSR